MKNRDFIITSLQSWDIEIGSTIKNTALELSKQNRVLYINPPMDYATRLRAMLHTSGKLSPAFVRRMEVIKGNADPIRIINRNLWVVDCPFTLHSVSKLPGSLFNLFNRENNKQIGRLIVREAAALGFEQYIHLIDTDIFRSRYLKEFIRPAVSVYYRRDYVVGFPYWRKHGLRTEQELAASADVVLANSSLFGRQLEAFNSNVHVINTGVDLELYNAGQQRPRPVDLTTISFPIIGFTGALLASRLDLKLLEALLERLPAFNFVFVGPQDNAFAQSALHGHRNAFFLGKKEPEELPTYIQYFDVCINPQVMNPITDGNYPLKIDEYLAMGKPVVATSTHTMRDVFGAHTHLATGVAEYVDAIGQAVTECNDPMLKQARIDFAHTHSWGHSVAKIYKAIEAYEGNSN